MTDPTPGAVLRGAVDLSSLRNRPQPPAPGQAPAAAAAGGVSPLVVDVTDATFPQMLELS
ncbi:MAG: co-chaperone YbbN, partial [Microbacterium sp.]|nr:co-chaperone YbbN [Microbacterium sp.]